MAISRSDKMPVWPLIATLAIQTLATMALFSLPAAAPVVVRWGLWYLAILALLILGRWQAREFIYMQF